jgi:hypothetical protein
MNTNRQLTDIKTFQLKCTGLIQSYLDTVSDTFKNDVEKEISNILKKVAKDYKLDYNELIDKYIDKKNQKKRTTRKDEAVDSEYTETNLYDRKIIDGVVLFVPENRIGDVYDENLKKIGYIDKKTGNIVKN